MTYLDDALTRLALTDLEYAMDGFEGLSNHGPMAAEALEAMGHADAIPRFVSAYLERLRPMPGDEPGTMDAGRPARLGRVEDAARWIACFDRRLDESPWPKVVAEEVPHLLDGIAAAAFHGVLRTSHAIRALEVKDSEPRRRELARGLAYWACRHKPLPFAAPPEEGPSLTLPAAFETLPLVPAAERVVGGLIVDRFEVLHDRHPFAATLARLELGDDHAATLSSLVALAARLVMVVPPRPAFVYLHAVTGTAATRRLLPYLDADGARVAVRRLVEAVLAVHATHAEPDSLARGVELTLTAEATEEPSSLARRASESLDDHTVKFVEAALSEHRLSGAPELLAAASWRLTKLP